MVGRSHLDRALALEEIGGAKRSEASDDEPRSPAHFSVRVVVVARRMGT